MKKIIENAELTPRGERKDMLHTGGIEPVTVVYVEDHDCWVSVSHPLASNGEKSPSFSYRYFF